MNSKLNIVDRGNKTAMPEWLADLMLRRDSKLASRFMVYYRELKQRPRRWRRLLRRKLALTVAGAALLLALAGGPIAAGSVLAEPIDTNATIAVINGEVGINDNGQCSLVEALINANATTSGQLNDDCQPGNLSGADTVSLPNNGAFELTAVYDTQFYSTGLPLVTSAVTIDGNGSRIYRSYDAGTPEFRILAVDSTGDLTLRDTTISNGHIVDPYNGGGGIFSKGALTVEGSTISDNYAYQGGGIDAEQVTIINSVISDNVAYPGDVSFPAGGGINAETLIVENSTISHNTAYYGGGIYAHEATISGSRIVDNVANSEYGGRGGGILSSVLTLTDSTVMDNTAAGGVGGGAGGGVRMDSGTISGSMISGNRAGTGQDGDNQAYPQSGKGGGVATTGPVTIVNSTFSYNEANEGGGLFVGGETALTHSTLTNNNARADIIGLDGDYLTVGGLGGGVLVAADAATCGALTASGNLISGNTASEPGREVLAEQGDQCAAAVTADAFNVFGRGGDSGVAGFIPGATDVIPTVGLSAILSPLDDNGGPTQTHALPQGSPALDIAPNDSCAAAPVNGVDQRGEPRNANGTGGNTDNECDAGSFELQAAGGGGQAFLISPSGNGTVGGVSFTSADILKYDPATGWSMVFDGSDVGITRNLRAFTVLGNGDILMSFAGNQRIAGVGTFAPQDIARFVPTTSGETTTGTFQWALDGSDHLLTTSGEKIDALADIGDGRWAISTIGTATVKLPNGTALKAQDEDALGLNPATGEWSAWFDGTPIPGLKSEDVDAMWIDPATGDIYVGIVGTFNLDGVKGNGRDIVKLTVDSGAPGGYVPSLWWDGSAAGFLTNIDGLEIVP